MDMCMSVCTCMRVCVCVCEREAQDSQLGGEKGGLPKGLRNWE